MTQNLRGKPSLARNRLRHGLRYRLLRHGLPRSLARPCKSGRPASAVRKRLLRQALLRYRLPRNGLPRHRLIHWLRHRLARNGLLRQALLRHGLR